MKSKNWTKEEDNLLTNYYTLYGIDECLKVLDRTKRSIQLRRKKLNILANNNIKDKYHKENLEKIVVESKTYLECLKKLGIKNMGSSYNTLKKYIKKYNISIEHFENNIIDVIHNKIDLSKILIENSTYNTTILKERLYKEGLKERLCEKCGQGEEWNGEHMSLILDHINGINNDNRIFNLRIVCPNCNSTLPTHCVGNKRMITKNNIINNNYIETHKKYKNKKTDKQLDYIFKSRTVERPTYEQLKMDIELLGLEGSGRKYGVCGNSIKKWRIFYEKNY